MWGVLIAGAPWGSGVDLGSLHPKAFQDPALPWIPPGPGSPPAKSLDFAGLGEAAPALKMLNLLLQEKQILPATDQTLHKTPPCTTANFWIY